MKANNKNTQDRTFAFSRRSFIKTTALAGGGMLIGFNLFEACKPNVEPSVDLANLNYHDFNAFIKISDEGKVTIFAPNPEIGQGVKTSMPMLIAEELDVAWRDVYIVQAPLDTKHYTRQLAGGSQSLRLAWNPLRQTGATARQMLVNAAAARWGVDSSECTTKEGVITNGKGETLGYGDVVKEAASLEIPEGVILKDSKNFSIIGKDAYNVDLDKIISGKPLFGLDYKEEGMVYAAVLRPPAFGQKLESYDATEAKTIPGVIDVIMIGEKANKLIDKGGNWTVILDRSDKVVVIAASTYAAFKGKKAIRANWSEDSPLESSAFHDEKLFELLNGTKFNTLRKDGNVKKAFAEADKVLEKTFESSFLPHNCMEPMNFFANVTEDKIHLVGPVQTPEQAAQGVADMLDRNVDEVHLEMTRMGGGFGRRLYGDFVFEAAEISNAIKKPVKMVSSREDDMTTGVYRPATKYRISASIKNGKITGYHLKEASVNGNSWPGISNYFPSGTIENYQFDVVNYNSNISTGAWRAPYTNFLASAEQIFFDELAEELQEDTIELRRKLLDIAKNRTDITMDYSPQRMEGVVNLVAEKSNWGKVSEGTYQGFSAYFSHNTHVAEVADIVIENGKPVVKRVTCAIDCGIVVNPLGANNQAVGGIIDGLGHMMYGELRFENGEPQSQNFDTYQLIRMGQTPQVDVHFVESNIAPTGLGEPTLPPIGAAVANAIYRATGQRLRKQPYMKYFKVEESTA